MQLGFPVKVLGPDGSGMPTHDARRPQSEPSLGRSLELAADAHRWLGRCGLRYWRLSSDLAPFATHPQHPRFHDAPSRFGAELAAFGAELASAGTRVSLHPSQFIVLGSPDAGITARSVADLEVQAALLDAMGAGPEAIVLLHAGGRYGDPAAARERLLTRVAALPGAVRARLALENDDRLWSAAEVLEICQDAKLPFVLDVHHDRCLPSPEWPELAPLIGAAAATWPPGVRPELHISSGRDRPDDRAHWSGIRDSDWCALAAALDESGADCDLMVEAKAKEHAVLALAGRIAGGLLPQPSLLTELPAWPEDLAAAEPYAQLLASDGAFTTTG